MEGWPALVVSLLAALDTAARVPAGMIRAYLAAESRPNAFKGNPCLNASRGALVFSRARRGTGLDVYNYEGPGDARGLPDKFELCLHVFWLHAAPPSTRHTPGQKPRKDGCGHGSEHFNGYFSRSDCLKDGRTRRHATFLWS